MLLCSLQLHIKRLSSPTSISRLAASVVSVLFGGIQQNRFLVVSPKCDNSMAVPSYVAALRFLDRTAIKDSSGEYSYANIMRSSWDIAKQLEKMSGCCLAGKRIAFISDNSVTSVISLWATWLLQGIAVPVCPSHPPREMCYVVEDSQSTVLLGNENWVHVINAIAESSCHRIKRLIVPPTSDTDDNSLCEDLLIHCLKTGLVPSSERALIIYTSGTTGPPKGVVLNHGNIVASMKAMIQCWEWTSEDKCLHCLPLHHVHGMINALLTPLYTGASCIMLPQFDTKQTDPMIRIYNTQVDGAAESRQVADSLSRLETLSELKHEITGIPSKARGQCICGCKVWKYLTSGDITIFHGVPTMYAKLLNDKSCGSEVQKACKRIRLMVSGSSALPTSVMDSWFRLTGHKLLERYGMTEIQMALTNPLHRERRSGTVGQPFPHVQVQLCRNSSSDFMDNGDERGELLVKGDTVFVEYWNRPKATEESFTRDGWFKTGDIAQLSDGYYKILGRLSIDIIKSGGFKISALEVESTLLLHEDILECAIIGKPDEVWGQSVAAVVKLQRGSTLNLEDLRQWCLDKMPKHHIPTTLFSLPNGIPKNSMGKVNKKSLAAELFMEHSVSV